MMTSPESYIVAGCKPWNRAEFDAMPKPAGTTWYFINSKEQLSAEWLETIVPRYIFFWHWSWIVPRKIFDRYECVCFHMTDVPFGRGGSPLQNLISRGFTETRLSALRMTEELDAGDVYMKLPLKLTGSAQEIFKRATRLCAEISLNMTQNNPQPTTQHGEPVVFPRRTPEQSLLPGDGDISQIYDHIRMLDAEGYPHAFCHHGDYELTFTGATLEGKTVRACVTIRKKAR